MKYNNKFWCACWGTNVLILQSLAYLFCIEHNLVLTSAISVSIYKPHRTEKVLQNKILTPVTFPVSAKQKTSHSKWALPAKPPGLGSTLLLQQTRGKNAQEYISAPNLGHRE